MIDVPQPPRSLQQHHVTRPAAPRPHHLPPRQPPPAAYPPPTAGSRSRHLRMPPATTISSARHAAPAGRRSAAPPPPCPFRQQHRRQIKARLRPANRQVIRAYIDRVIPNLIGGNVIGSPLPQAACRAPLLGQTGFPPAGGAFLPRNPANFNHSGILAHAGPR